MDTGRICSSANNSKYRWKHPTVQLSDRKQSNKLHPNEMKFRRHILENLSFKQKNESSNFDRKWRSYAASNMDTGRVCNSAKYIRKRPTVQLSDTKRYNKLHRTEMKFYMHTIGNIIFPKKWNIKFRQESKKI